MKSRIAILSALLLCASAFDTHAAFDMFLKLDGIDGESQDKTHLKEINVLAWSWGMSNSGTVSGGLTTGRVTIQDLSITKFADTATAKIMQHTAQGKHIPQAVFTIRKAGDKPLEFLIITMTDVLITSVSTGGSGGEDRLVENITLNFAKVAVEYVEQRLDGSVGVKVPFSWDIAANKAF